MFVPPVVVGLVLRLWNLPVQVLVEDELHVVQTALKHTLGEILFTYRRSDPCLPMAGFYRWAMDHGVVFSEMGLRAPVLVASVASVGVVPLLAWRWVGTSAAVTVAWLIALSPSLILYGRIVRPYGPVSLLAPLAVLGFAYWLLCEERAPVRRLSPSRVGLVVWAGAGALAAYFHLGVAPMIGAVLVYAGAERLLRRAGARSWRALAAAGGTLAVFLAFWVVPAWRSLLWLRQVKGGRGRIDPSAWAETVGLQFGTASPWVGALAALVAMIGFVALWRRQRRFALLGLAAVVGQVAGLLVLRPLGLANALIVNRYVLSVTPILLLWLAVGLVVPWTFWRSHRRDPRATVGLVLSALLVALLVATGPLVRRTYWTSSFIHFRDFLRFDLSLAAMPPQAVPAFYRDLAQAPEGSLLEIPFRTGWSFTRAPYVYQLQHQRRVYVSGTDKSLCDPHLDFENRLCLGWDKLLESPARYLVLHRDVQEEERRLTGVPQPELAFRPEAWESHRRYAAAWSKRLRDRFGPPAWDQPELEVWDLDRARSGMGKDSGPVEGTQGRSTENSSSSGAVPTRLASARREEI